MRSIAVVSAGGAALLAVVLIVTLRPGESSPDEARADSSSEVASARTDSTAATPLSSEEAAGLFDQAPPTAKQLALLVGIDAYPPPLPALRGCVKDVQRAQTALVERFDFDERSVRLLTDEAATHENIVRGFRWLIEHAQTDSEVLFWFSGHGSQVPDDGTERHEEWDSTFLAWDSRIEGRLGEYDVVDDEVNSLLRELLQKTTRVAVITDSCHSGGVVRGERMDRAQPRSVPAGRNMLDTARLASFWPANLTLESTELDETSYVHIAACSPLQLAYEYMYEGEDGETIHQGALSFFVLDGLERCRPGTTWGQIADEAAVRVSTERPGQTVCKDGALNRQVFSGDFAPPIRGFRAQNKGAVVVVDAGRVHNLVVGSRLAVYRNLLQSEDEEPIGKIELDRVDAIASLGTWIGDGQPELEHGVVLRAVETERPEGTEPLAVFVVEPGFAELLPTDGELCVLEEEPSYADVFLRRGPSGRVALYDEPGHCIEECSKTEPDDVARWLEGELRSELDWRALYALAQEPGDLRVSAQLVEASDEDARDHKTRPRASVSVGEGGGFSAGGSVFHATGGPSDLDWQLATLEVENESDEPLHVAVLSIAEHRGVFLIWPAASTDNRVAPGEKERIPVGLVMPENWDLERAMRDRYLVIATPKKADFSMFREEKMRGGDGGPLPQALRRATAGPVLRGGLGGEPEAKEVEGWGILAVDVHVSSDE